MLPGSRRRFSSFGQVKISAVGQMQRAKASPHEPVGVQVQTRAGEDQDAEKSRNPGNDHPTKQLESAWHEEPGGMNRAAVKEDPEKCEPGGETFVIRTGKKQNR